MLACAGGCGLVAGLGDDHGAAGAADDAAGLPRGGGTDRLPPSAAHGVHSGPIDAPTDAKDSGAGDAHVTTWCESQGSHDVCDDFDDKQLAPAWDTSPFNVTALDISVTPPSPESPPGALLLPNSTGGGWLTKTF